MSNIIINTVAKMFLAAICGALLGIPRTLRNKPAGIKTHSILCFTACALIIISDIVFSSGSYRIVAGVIQGIGFLGSGVIYLSKDEQSVKGLTSSVILWLDTVIGIICATDYWYLAIITILIFWTVMFVTIKLEKVLNKWAKDHNHENDSDDY